MIDLTPIVEAIVALVAAVITAFVIPWLKGKIDADKLEEIELWVTVAVEAAEQLYVGSGRGAEKKNSPGSIQVREASSKDLRDILRENSSMMPD